MKLYEFKSWLDAKIKFFGEFGSVKLAFEAAVKAKVDLSYVDFTPFSGETISTLDDRASLDGASLDGASLVGASLVGASLVGASLVGASLVGASLDGASLDGASLDGASLVGASLRAPGLYSQF